MISTSNIVMTLKGLLSIDPSNLLIFIWFRPPATPLNHVAP
jgi:hypothetical protein